jgi:hypothetical protein
MADSESNDGAQGGLPATTGDGALRASHADRDKIVEVLRTAAGDGRLSPEELDERLELALTAKTYAELAGLTTDLPAAGAAPVPAVAGDAAEAKELVKIEVGSGNARRDGRWVVPKEMDIRITSGNVVLDFTNATITQPLLRIGTEVRSGVLTLITKPGIVVDVDDVSVRSGNVMVRAPWGHDVPALLRVEIAGAIRSGNITARPPRRSFWQWLRRAPRPYAITA